MARPREFSEDAAIEGAMRVFWRKGFKATNLPDLLQAMNITRGSFYKAFTDKEAVYLRALAHYDQTVVTETVSTLGACEDPDAENCLKLLFAPATDRKAGCFICNAMVEVAPDNPEVAALTLRMSQRITAAIKSVIQSRAPDRSDEELEASADLVMHLYFGFQAVGKASQSQSDWTRRLRRVLPEPRAAS